MLLENANSDIALKLSSILSQLLSPDNEAIAKATADLREISSEPLFIPSLFAVVAKEQQPGVRKLAAVVFRRKISKKWKLLGRQEKNGIRQAALEQLLNESDPLVSQSLCQIVSEVAKHDLAKNGDWPDLFNLIQQSLSSNEPRSVEMGLYLTSAVCDTSANSLAKHYSAILTLLGTSLQRLCSFTQERNQNIINSVTNSMSYCVQAFNSIIPYLGSDHQELVRPLVLLCVTTTQFMLAHDESLAGDCIEVFESLIEAEVAFISPFVKDLVGFALQVAVNNEYEDSTRSRCLSLLRWIISLKKKSIIKLGLIEPILDAVFPLTTAPCGEEDESFTADDNESQTPITAAVNLIDEMALHLPPEKLFAHLLPKIKSAVESDNVCQYRGAILAIACVAEGTSEFIKNNHLKQFLELICQASIHENIIVRNAALFAIGQFSEYLQPDISEYVAQLMPLLFEILNKTPTEKENSLTKAYYALENFIENLDQEKFMPYLDHVMTHLLATLRGTTHVHTKELVVSSIGAVANCAKENLVPYLEDILTLLKLCLSTVGQSEEVKDELSLLHTQTLDTLGVLARTVGKAHFIGLAEDCLKLGVNLVENDNDPDMRRAAFGLFSSMSTVLEQQMAPYLPVIVKYLTDSVASVEGVVAHLNKDADGTSNLSFLDENEETDISSSQDEDDDELEDIEGFTVENSYIDEKADACETLGELSKNTIFLEYLEQSFVEVCKVTDFPHPDVRRSAITACGDLVSCALKQNSPLYGQFIAALFPIICKTIVADIERSVVMATIAAVNDIIDKCGEKAFPHGQESLKTLMQSIMLVMQERAACQDADDDVTDDQQQAEHDEMLYEYCGDLFPAISGAVGAGAFLSLFLECLPTLVSKLKQSSTVSERSFATGTIAETFEKLGPGSSKTVVDQLMPKLINTCRDGDSEVRNNSVYAIGVLLMNAQEEGVKHYASALQCLSQVLSNEENRRVKDNVLGAVARLIAANQNAVPVNQVLPVILDNLPILEDHEEDKIVYGCIARIMHDQSVCDASIQTRIVKMFASVLTNSEVDEGIRSSIISEIQNLNAKVPVVTELCKGMPGHESSALLQLFQISN